MKVTLRPTGGHILDIDSSELGDQFLSLAHNVNTRKGFPSRIPGRRVAYGVDAGAAPITPLHLMNFNLNTFNWWLLLGANSIYAIESANFYDVSLVDQQTVNNSHEWVSTLLNGIPVFTNGKDLPMFWNGDSGTPAGELPGFPAATVCRGVVAFRYHIFAYNIDGPSGTFENLLMWSDAAEPGAIPIDWTPSPGDEAGSTILADTPGRIVTGVPLNTVLAMYKPQSIYAVEYAGQQPDNIFTNRAVIRTQGALGPHCVVERKNDHFVVGNDDVVLFNGVDATSIAEDRIKLALANSIDETNQLNTFVIRDLSRREYWVCIPEAGSQFATVAHVWDQKRNTWTTRDLNNVRHGRTGVVSDTTPDDTWNADSRAWDEDLTPWSGGSTAARERIVLGEQDLLYVEDTGDVVSVAATIARYDHDFGDATQRKLTSRVWVMGNGAGISALTMRLGARASSDSAIEWGPYRPLQQDGTPYEIEGRYISIEVTGTTADEWTVNRIQIDGVYTGGY